jgi:formylglycine-generating enzyme required for sulfatase activity
MGSSKEEKLRLNRKDWMRWAMGEEFRHRVRITQGFWLADSACTQAMWLALMGNNPSHFKAILNRPVEQVSYHDVQKFLVKLQTRLPAGLLAELPTEAQWEFACRAGANTAFSFGDSINTDQVNFDGSGPFSQRGASKARGHTVAVRSLPANPWGLFEMHGNVWEWCADGPRPYEKDYNPNDEISEPKGPPDGDRRVLRGGSWDYPAGFARAAFRSHVHRGLDWHGGGFRLALRSTSTSTSALVPGTGTPGFEFEPEVRAVGPAGSRAATQKPKGKP